MPATLILRLARERRWPIVVSATRNALAISGVVRPPSVLNVSATCASIERAGWQQVNMRRRRSSVIEEAGISAKGSVLSGSMRRRSFDFRLVARRIRSTALLRAVVNSHAVGSAGIPSRRQRSSADDPGFLQNVFGEVEVPERAHEGGDRPAPHLAVEAGGRDLEFAGCNRRVRIWRGPPAP